MENQKIKINSNINYSSYDYEVDDNLNISSAEVNK